MSALFDAYVAGNAPAFYGGHFAAAEDRRRAVVAARRPLAPSVADTLDRQNTRYARSPARDAHLTALRAGAVAVVSGQQVGLFLGPLFTLYKAASAIAAARALAAETSSPVVPVFWLQSEDHDLPEIAACHVPRRDGEALCLQLPANTQDRRSLAHHVLPDQLGDCLAHLHAQLDHLPHAAEHLECLERHYRAGRRWVDAFADVLAELFAEDGLVLIDPRDEELAAAAADIHRRALLDAAPIAAMLAQRVAELRAAGFEVPVHIRPDAPLSFFHSQEADGPRYRLEPAANGYREVGGNDLHSLDALLAVLDATPLRFSTSVLLRPILQDTLLPTAAYVGGPAEVAYFAQIQPLFGHFGLPMPLVVPRARITLVEEKTARLLERLRLRAADAQCDEDELLARAGRCEPSTLSRTDLVHRLCVPFDDALSEVARAIAGSGPGLEVALSKTRATVEMAVGKLADKYEKALLHRDESLVDAVRRVRSALYPNGAPQERVFGVSYFAARYGQRPFLERVLSAIEPFAAEPIVLALADEGPRTML